MQLLASEEYGLRCLLRVAGEAGAGPVPVARVAAAEGISADYAAKLLRRLRLAGLLTSVRGAEGGYRLARPPAEISLWSALEALGGSFYDEAFCACHAGQRRRCIRARDCSLRPLWRALQDGVRETLSRIHLSDLQRDEQAMAAWLAREHLIRIEGAPA